MSGQSPITIIRVSDRSDLLQQVISLGDRNSKFLGHFPRGAYEREAAKDRIIAAVDGKVLAGYILYWTGRDRAKIQHCCVDPGFRGRGVGRRLVDAVKERTAHLPCIELHCARDFKESCAFWAANGFVPFDEKRGRGHDGRPLTLYVYNRGTSDLFISQLDAHAGGRLLVVVDTNIAYDWQDEDRPRAHESLSLRADWLASEIDLRITDQAFVDSDRIPDRQERQRRKGFLRSLGMINENRDVAEGVREGLAELFPPDPSVSLLADIAHMAAAVSVQADAFVTNDTELHDRADEIHRRYGLLVCTPGVLITHLDEGLRTDVYQPARLSGTPVATRRPGAADLPKIVRDFLDYGAGERLARLETRVHELSAAPSRCDVILIEWPHGTPVGFLALDRRQLDRLRVEAVRFRHSRITQVLARHTVSMLLKRAVAEQRPLVEIVDPHPWEGLGDELKSFGFVRQDGAWCRPVLVGGFSRAGLVDRLLATGHYDGRVVLPDDLGEVERLHWPAKLLGAGAHSFIVPIKSEWAAHLFEERLAAGRLHGGEPALMLNTENVYYRAARPRVLKTPGRILWYVSRDDDCPGELRACSSIVDVEVGPAKRLYAKNSRLGVFEWRDVVRTAHGNPLAPIMAVRFGATEMLKTPVAYQTIESTLGARGVRMPPLITASKIPEKCFEDLYRLSQSL